MKRREFLAGLIGAGVTVRTPIPRPRLIAVQDIVDAAFRDLKAMGPNRLHSPVPMDKLNAMIERWNAGWKLYDAKSVA